MVNLYFKGEERKEKREKNIVDDNTLKNTIMRLLLRKRMP
jgi:hypothetical protein